MLKSRNRFPSALLLGSLLMIAGTSANASVPRTVAAELFTAIW